jgi:hydroxyacylglutathione hydrolase
MPKIIPIPAFSDNYIWAIRDGANAAVVDPGDAAPVEAWLAREGVALTAIVATHHHGDHVGGIDALVATRAIPVYGPSGESIPHRTHALGEGDTIDVAGVALSLRVLDIPGHTAGHIAYVGDNGGVPLAFVGDTLFAVGCGRLFEGTPPQMWQSLSKLAALAPATEIYCGHEYTLANIRFARAVEPTSAALAEREARERQKRDRGDPTLPSTIGEERATNPFIRAGEPSVFAAAERRAGRPLRDAVESFATLRAWKNAF